MSLMLTSMNKLFTNGSRRKGSVIKHQVRKMSSTMPLLRNRTVFIQNRLPAMDQLLQQEAMMVARSAERAATIAAVESSTMMRRTSAKIGASPMRMSPATNASLLAGPAAGVAISENLDAFKVELVAPLAKVGGYRFAKSVSDQRIV